jgi:hypothetical protein
MKKVIFALAFCFMASNSYGVLLKASNDKFVDAVSYGLLTLQSF